MSRGSVPSRSRSRLPSKQQPSPSVLGAAGLVALALAAGCSVLLGVDRVPDDGSPRPEFDHGIHLDKGLECTDCHETSEDEVAAGMPTLETCMDCHEEIDAKKPADKRVAAWITQPGGEPAWSDVTDVGNEVIFSHVAHYEDVDCDECHVDIESSERVTSDLRVDMDACMECHAESDASNACETCHSEIGLDAPPPNHGRLWSVLHGEIARRRAPESRAEDCSLCHTQNTCATCHATQPPRDHSESWRVGGGHGIASSMDRDRCAACHEPDACVRCHETAAPRSHRGSWGSRRNRHCVGCHEPVQARSNEGCGVCHRGTPSHRLAPPKPADHRPDLECLLCHSPLPHADNGGNCNRCHR